MTRDEVRDFFQEAPVNIIDNPSLRDPQREGYDAAIDHFSKSQKHAIIRLPVGCGKTGLMGVVPFGLAQGRVLILAPNVTIRQGIYNELNYSNRDCFYRKTNVLSDFSKGPHVAIIDGPSANLSHCEQSHFCIVNIQQLASSADKWLPRFEDDFFDLILVDEGHHNVAESWQKVFQRFPNAKVISFTATPFRSDGKEVTGELVYSYSFTRAMAKGYIKQVGAANVTPSEIYFTYKGDEHHHTLQEILEMREEAWFRKGVSADRKTNISIVEASIAMVEKLRTSGTHHQIIAAACSIDHARDIAALYRERNYEAEAVDSRMKDDSVEAVYQRLRNGALDCIVQVNKLGEGFDHKPISVAAIFRPFRSLSPYVQFVGRALRAIHQNNPLHPDNQAYVISHIGLQQDDRWNDFKNFDKEDQLKFAELLGISGDTVTDADEETTLRRRKFKPDMLVLDQFLEQSFEAEQFLDPNDEGALDELMQRIPELFGGISAEELGITREEVKRRLQTVRAAHEFELETIPVQPQVACQQRKRRLNDRTRSVAGDIVQTLKLAPNGVELRRHFPRTQATNNLAITISLMHSKVNQEMGFNKGERAELELGKLEQALNRLDEFGDTVEQQIREKTEIRG